MTSNRFETARPFYFYVKVVLPGLFPWIVLCAIAGVHRAREIFSGRPFAQAWRDARARLAAEPGPAAWRWRTPSLAGRRPPVLLDHRSKRPSYMLPCSVPRGDPQRSPLDRGLRAPARERGAARRPGERLLWIAVMCAAGGLVALLAGTAGLAIGFSEGKYDALLSRRLLFGGTGRGSCWRPLSCSWRGACAGRPWPSRRRSCQSPSWCLWLTPRAPMPTRRARPGS